ncbi:MAG: YdcF family protein [Alphaproteobacteria bacterium]|nr:YdcF family protein [Alphaproteobacteria bacterium]
MIKKIFLSVSGLVLVLWFGGFMVFAHRINSYQIDKTTVTDAVIALTGGKYRIVEAANVLKQGLAKHLFISGVNKDSSWKDIKNVQNIHIDNDDNVTIGYKAKNTIGNAKETISWLRSKNIKSIRLVTSNYHVERSLIEFETQAKDLKIIPHPVYSDNLCKKWWRSWHTFLLIFEEYNKMLCVYFRSKFSIWG